MMTLGLDETNSPIIVQSVDVAGGSEFGIIQRWKGSHTLSQIARGAPI